MEIEKLEKFYMKQVCSCLHKWIKEKSENHPIEIIIYSLANVLIESSIGKCTKEELFKQLDSCWNDKKDHIINF